MSSMRSFKSVTDRLYSRYRADIDVKGIKQVYCCQRDPSADTVPS